MDVREEEWLTTGQAAKVLHRDIRTVRRWVDEGWLRCRVSPGGHRQIALSSALSAQRPTKATAARRRKGTSRQWPPDCLGSWAAEATDWDRWAPPPTMDASTLQDLRGSLLELQDRLAEVDEALTTALVARPELPSEPTTDGPGVLDWLRALPGGHSAAP
jgi:hypothetical protein